MPRRFGADIDGPDVSFTGSNNNIQANGSHSTITVCVDYAFNIQPVSFLFSSLRINKTTIDKPLRTHLHRIYVHKYLLAVPNYRNVILIYHKNPKYGI